MNPTERRKHPRVALATTVALFDRTGTGGDGDDRSRPRPLGQFPLIDLSIRGALVEGDVGVPVGTMVGVHLKLPGTQAQVEGKVVRLERSPKGIATALLFEVIPTRDDGALGRVVTAILDELRKRG